MLWVLESLLLDYPIHTHARIYCQLEEVGLPKAVLERLDAVFVHAGCFLDPLSLECKQPAILNLCL